MNTQFSQRKDSLGELQVPALALFGVQTQRAVDNFPISGLKPWRAFIWSWRLSNARRRWSNFDLGLFNNREADGKHFRKRWRLHRTSRRRSNGRQVDDQFVVDPFQAGAGTSHNMNANEVIANRATQILGEDR